MNNSNLISYPKLKRDEEYRDKHNLFDPYHWIKEESPEISNWIDDQNSISLKIIRENDSYPKILSRLKELYNYEKISSFSKINSFYVFYKNNGLQNHSVLYIQKDINSNPEILLDPNSLSIDGSISISSISFSKALGL